MLGTSMTLDNLQDLLIFQLEDLYSAEKQIIDALPKLADAAYTPELRSSLREHLSVTQKQRQRLEQCFRLLNHEPRDMSSEAMQGLIEDGQTICNAEGDTEVKDAAIIAAVQRVEHYEIAGYGCARSFAHRLNRNDVVNLLQQTLEEEGQADKILTHVAESWVNQEAARA
jgi:ferritin-like metal-binding protein YciE